MTITVKNHKKFYAPAEGVVEQISVEVDFSKETNAADYYKVMTIQENLIIYGVCFVVTEAIVSSGSSTIVMAVANGGQVVTTSRDPASFSVGGGSVLSPIISSETTVDFIGEEATTTSEVLVSTPLLTEVAPLDIGVTLGGDPVVSGKIKIKAIIGKAL